MAVTASGLFLGTWKRALNGTIVMNLDLETGQGYLISDSATPNFTAATSAYSDLSATEVSGGSWTATGVDLTGTTIDIGTTNGTWIFDASDVSVATTTLTNAMAYVYYLEPLAGDDNVFLVDFVTAVSTSNGTFEIVWAAPGSGGIFNIDMTP